ncbi:MAG: sulfotransferase family 2 domain-containing protein [Pseudomonadota bacterium]
MIYSPRRKYLFVHIPKTGGTSLALALEARAQAADVLIGDTPKATRRRKRVKELTARGRLWKHAKLADVDGWLGPAELEPLTVFTIVRNPWDRLVSYYMWLREQSFDHPAVVLAKRLEFGGFLRAPEIQASLRANPYRSYVTDAAGAERCDLYLRFEHLEEDTQSLARLLGVKVELPHVNRSDRPRDYRELYSAEEAAIVADVCAADIARFGYEFEG